MSQWLPKMRPQRCMRGGVLPFTPTNLGTVSLYNNSTGAEVLVIWYVNTNSSDTVLQAGIIQGKQGTAQTTVAPLITGNPIFAGQVCKLDTTTVMPFDQCFQYGQNPSASINADLPWAILQPGWSFVVQDTGDADEMCCSFVWQAAHVADIYESHCTVCDAIIEMKLTP